MASTSASARGRSIKPAPIGSATVGVVAGPPWPRVVARFRPPPRAARRGARRQNVGGGPKIFARTSDPLALQGEGRRSEPRSNPTAAGLSRRALGAEGQRGRYRDVPHRARRRSSIFTTYPSAGGRQARPRVAAIQRRLHVTSFRFSRYSSACSSANGTMAGPPPGPTGASRPDARRQGNAS
jgi:hypothetical protein